MSANSLFWRSLPYPKDKFLVKGTELARAVIPGTLSRFVVYETRTILANREPDLRFTVRDADTVSDSDVREGIRPKIVASFDEPDDAVAWAQSQ